MRLRRDALGCQRATGEAHWCLRVGEPQRLRRLRRIAILESDWLARLQRVLPSLIHCNEPALPY
jgi:hypothetical protein